MEFIGREKRNLIKEAFFISELFTALTFLCTIFVKKKVKEQIHIVENLKNFKDIFRASYREYSEASRSSVATFNLR